MKEIQKSDVKMDFGNKIGLIVAIMGLTLFLVLGISALIWLIKK